MRQVRERPGRQTVPIGRRRASTAALIVPFPGSRAARKPSPRAAVLAAVGLGLLAGALAWAAPFAGATSALAAASSIVGLALAAVVGGRAALAALFAGGLGLILALAGPGATSFVFLPQLAWGLLSLRGPAPVRRVALPWSAWNLVLAVAAAARLLTVPAPG